MFVKKNRFLTFPKKKYELRKKEIFWAWKIFEQNSFSSSQWGYFPTKEIDATPLLPLCFVPILMKDVQYAESNEKSIFLFFHTPNKQINSLNKKRIF